MEQDTSRSHENPRRFFVRTGDTITFVDDKYEKSVKFFVNKGAGYPFHTLWYQLVDLMKDNPATYYTDETLYKTVENLMRDMPTTPNGIEFNVAKLLAEVWETSIHQEIFNNLNANAKNWVYRYALLSFNMYKNERRLDQQKRAIKNAFQAGLMNDSIFITSVGM